jgi:RNA polymerase sigma-70 factor, ECF subfamily
MQLARKVQDMTDPIAEMVLAGRHREAVEQCVQAHGLSIGRVCMAFLGNQAEADDAVQETLLAAYRSFATYRAEGTVRSWLFAIARRVCARKVESRKREMTILELVPRDEDHNGLQLRQRARVVRIALDKIKPSERDALVLRYVADLSHKEIAEACDIDEPAARKRISRALQSLAAVLPKESDV